MKPPAKEKLRCSFCGRDEDQVTYLLAGPGGIYICGACVDICVNIINRAKASGPTGDPAR